MEKTFYSITEVAEELGVETSKLRYWEKQGLFKIHKTGGGRRQYTRKDIETIRAVYMLREKIGMTLPGAKREMSINKKTVASAATVISRLQSIRNELQAIRSEFEAMEKQAISSNLPSQTPLC
jgi:DNA-binding transcriptional MerR regulator